MIAAILLGAVAGVLAGWLALGICGRQSFIWSPWMSPREVDEANGFEPLEGPQEVHPNPLTGLLRAMGVIGPEQRAEVDPEPELMMDPGEGLLW